jgi:hypothetical protein
MCIASILIRQATLHSLLAKVGGRAVYADGPVAKYEGRR